MNKSVLRVGEEISPLVFGKIVVHACRRFEIEVIESSTYESGVYPGTGISAPKEGIQSINLFFRPWPRRIDTAVPSFEVASPVTILAWDEFTCKTSRGKIWIKISYHKGVTDIDQVAERVFHQLLTKELSDER